MNKRWTGALTFGISLWGASITRDDFRRGRSRLWPSGGVIPFEASREANPLWFWTFTAINIALIAVLLAVSILLVVRPGE
jgi:hypothetical protein